MALRSLSIRDVNIWRSLVLPISLAGVALTVTIIGAVVLGNGGGIDSINSFIERWSGDSTEGLGTVGGWAPFGFVFVLGMASAVNPCGFAMLPAYLGLYLGTNDKEAETTHLGRTLVKAIIVGTAVSAGIVFLFGLLGTAIGLGASFVGNLIPWLGLTIGIILTLFASWTMAGAKLYSSLGARAASRMGNPNELSPKGYFIFGVSYGTASLSCTLPLFLSVVGFTVTGVSTALVVGNFFLFAFGMASFIFAFTLTMALFKGTMVGIVRKALPYIQPVGTTVMLLAGMYIVYYWLTIGRDQL